MMEYKSPEKCPTIAGLSRYGVEKISQLATLEVQFQTQQWGEVEDSSPPPLHGDYID
jgi:hypothetical protein